MFNSLFELLKHLNIFWQNGQWPEWGAWSYLVLALLVVVEGPIATLLGAAAASAGVMRPWLVFLAASTGNLIADTLWYSVGYVGRLEWFLRFGRRLGISHAQLDRLQHMMHKHAARILFFAKLSMSLMIPSLIAAGLVKAPWRRWFPAVFSGELVWTGSLVLIGYYTTEAIKRVEQGIEYFILAASVAFIIFMLWAGRRILRESAEQDAASEPDGDLPLPAKE
jgi:membrane protein DedA with SNARE-associated domain